MPSQNPDKKEGGLDIGLATSTCENHQKEQKRTHNVHGGKKKKKDSTVNSCIIRTVHLFAVQYQKTQCIGEH